MTAKRSRNPTFGSCENRINFTCAAVTVSPFVFRPTSSPASRPPKYTSRADRTWRSPQSKLTSGSGEWRWRLSSVEGDDRQPTATSWRGPPGAVPGPRRSSRTHRGGDAIIGDVEPGTGNKKTYAWPHRQKNNTWTWMRMHAVTEISISLTCVLLNNFPQSPHTCA